MTPIKATDPGWRALTPAAEAAPRGWPSGLSSLCRGLSCLQTEGTCFPGCSLADPGRALCLLLLRDCDIALQPCLRGFAGGPRDLLTSLPPSGPPGPHRVSVTCLSISHPCACTPAGWTEEAEVATPFPLKAGAERFSASQTFSLIPGSEFPPIALGRVFILQGHVTSHDALLLLLKGGLGCGGADSIPSPREPSLLSP